MGTVPTGGAGVPERPRGQSCLLVLCPLRLTLATVPCPLQLQLLLLHLLLCKEEGGREGVQRLREPSTHGEPPCSPSPTATLAPRYLRRRGSTAPRGAPGGYS